MNNSELTAVRGPEQWGEIFLAIENPSVVLACRINQTFSGHDSILQFAFDTVTSGSYSAVTAGMTCFIGSSAGAFDKGIVRIRKAPTSSIIYIGETSAVLFADNDYVTIVNEHSIWTKPWVTPPGEVNKVEELVVYMDGDIAYTDQNLNCDPVPLMGPDNVKWLTGATVSINPTAADSWVLGSTIASYSWSAPGSSASSNMTTATPTITYNAAGSYKISCTITAANGKSTTGYRLVFVFSTASMPMTSFVLDNVTSDAQNGVTTFTVTAFGNSLRTQIRDRAHVILFAKDYYNKVQQSFGPIADYENIIADGWIAGESIDWASERGAVKFTVQGPQFWLSKSPSFSVGLRDTTGTPTSWLYYTNLTVDAALWNIVHWRSTTDTVVDIYKTNDTRRAPSLIAQPGVLWEQLNQLCNNSILAVPRCNRYGQLYVQIDTQFMPLANRSTIPTTMALVSGDWVKDSLQLNRSTVAKTAYVQASGVSWDGTTGHPLISRAPGTAPKQFGAIVNRENLLLVDQDQLNELSALILANDNNEYPSLTLTLAQNNRFFDICPRQYVTLTVTSTDTIRGISFTDKKFIPRRIVYKHSEETGEWVVDLELEAETGSTADIISITVPYVPPAGTNIWTAPKRPPYQSPQPGFIGGGWNTPYIPKTTPPVIPPGLGGETCPLDASANGPFVILTGSSIIQYDLPRADTQVSLTLRAGAATNKTRYQINGRFQKKVNGIWVDTDDDDFYNINGYLWNGTLGTTAVHDALNQQTKQQYRTGYFNPAANVDLHGQTGIGYGGRIAVEIAGDNTFAPASVVGTFSSTAGQATVVPAQGQGFTYTSSGGLISVDQSDRVISDMTGTDHFRYYTNRITINPPTGVSYKGLQLYIKGFHYAVPQSGPFNPDQHGMNFSYQNPYGDEWSVSIPVNADDALQHQISFDTVFTHDATYMPVGANIRLNIGWRMYTFPQGFTPFSLLNRYLFILHPESKYRILMDSLFLWNVCS